MMSDELTISRIEPEQTDLILPLLARVFGPEDITARQDYWRWKHVENPFGSSACMIAESGGTAVGLRAFMRWSWTVGGASHQAVRAVDTATHPEWRGRGLFTRLTTSLLGELEHEGVRFVFNTPNSSSRPGYLKMGWRQVGRVPLMVKICRYWDALRGKSSSSAQGQAVHNLPSQTQLRPEAVLSEKPAAVSGCESRLHTPKSAEYLRWRYSNCPVVQYGHRMSGDVEVIFRVRTRMRRREVSLSEVLVPDRQDAIASAVQLVRDIARESCADYIVASAPNRTPVRRVLLRAGFFPALPLGPIFTVRNLAEGHEKLALDNWSNWCCSIGDLELF